MASVENLAGSSLIDLCRGLRERGVSAVELMQQTIAAIDRTRSTLRAVVSRRKTDDLLAEARAAQARLDRGEARPLEGIPFGVKDLEDIAGVVTTYGSELFADNVAAQDSTQVTRLKAAGAIAVGKTNTAEFGFGAVTKNRLYGATTSPWDMELSPGGSSGGAAAALTSGVLPLVTAHDGGGSIRVPASYTGAFGFKPTHGRVPVGPADRWESSALVAYGPLTRTVADAALVLDQLVGIDPLDLASLPSPGFRYAERLEGALPRPLRVAYSRDFGTVPVELDVANAVATALERFCAAGHRMTVIEGGPPDLAIYWGLLVGRQLGEWLGDRLAGCEDQISRSLLKAIEGARAAEPAFWDRQARARMDVVRWFAQVFAAHDLLFTPTVPCGPPPAAGPSPSHVGDVRLPLSSVAAFTMPVNFAGLPAASVCAGRSSAGLPIGLQIIGPRDADDRVLRAAREFERTEQWIDWPAKALADKV